MRTVIKARPNKYNMKKYQEKNQKYEKKRKKFKSVTFFVYDDAKKKFQEL